jgi:hypothetical protein
VCVFETEVFVRRRENPKMDYANTMFKANILSLTFNVNSFSNLIDVQLEQKAILYKFSLIKTYIIYLYTYLYSTKCH